MRIFKRVLFFTSILLSTILHSQQKINGASIVSPPKPVGANCYRGLKEINANWVAIIPYAFTPHKTPKVQFDGKNYQWWGEKSEGATKLIQYAKKQGFKIMLKPHIWYQKAWIGDFKLDKTEDWNRWEKEYTRYILHFAKIAQEQKVDLFCIGTELKKVVIERPHLFKRIIKQVRVIYKGKLTYAANWNSLREVNFWGELDIIGVDAYYPLSDKKEPTVDELNKAWQPIKKDLKMLSETYKKPILFTEYGFESCDYNTKTTWGSNGKYEVNDNAQVNAYTSYFESFYNENWFLGGFFWKWHLTPNTLRNKDKSFTPQNKQTLKLLKKKFNKYLASKQYRLF